MSICESCLASDNQQNKKEIAMNGSTAILVVPKETTF
jgi:hypothetical protein